MSNPPASRQSPVLLILALSIAAALLIPALFMDGMFMDGLIYSCVGKNLSVGIGTFWDPQFSSTYMVSYHEQPPLMFGMESVFFKILGTSFYTERVYCLFMAVMCFLALRYVWNKLFADAPAEKRLLWVPVIFFFVSPVIFWAYTNNVEEASMVVFALLSAGFQLAGIRSKGNGYGWFALGGVALIASSMCKGMQGLFPLIIPLTWFFIVRSISFRKAFVGNVIVFAVPAVFYLLISLYEPAVNSYTAYFHDRLATTFNVAETATTSSRFFILFELLLNILPALFVSLLLTVAARKITMTYSRKALFFMVVGFAGILPLMVTLEQRGFYLVTGLPFIAIGLALFTLRGAQAMQEKTDRVTWFRRSLATLAVLIITGTVISTVWLAGTPKRDVDLLHDVELIGHHCGPGKTATADASIWSNWSLQGYLVRYHNISLARPSDPKADFYIAPKGSPAPAGYIPANLPTLQYDLFSSGGQ